MRFPEGWVKQSICFLRNRGPGAERFGRSSDASFMLGCCGGGERLGWRWSREQPPPSSTHSDICFSSQALHRPGGQRYTNCFNLEALHTGFSSPDGPLGGQTHKHTHPPTHQHRIRHMGQCSSRHMVTSTAMPPRTEL